MFAADAVARLSGTVGVATVTAGPGMFYPGTGHFPRSYFPILSFLDLQIFSAAPFPGI